MKGTKNLTQGPILKQLFTLAMPIMATSFIQMAYSLTDMAWVGRIGSEAIAAVGSVGILTWMSTSISLLNKVGSEVSVGQAIGAQNEQAARAFASHNPPPGFSSWAIPATALARFQSAHLHWQPCGLHSKQGSVLPGVLQGRRH